MKNGFKVMDSDLHTMEPDGLWERYLAEPFKPFTFSPAGAAVYQLGPYGTAAKKLKGWDLKH